MSCLRYETKTAKRRHRNRCEMTGLPIEPGDRYTVSAGVDDCRDFWSIKAFAVLQEMAEDSMDRNGDDTWDPSEAREYLGEWLRRQFGHDQTYCGSPPRWRDHPEIEACLDAAVEFWRKGRVEVPRG